MNETNSLLPDLEMEEAMTICSICLKAFDPSKKHMCDGCGTTFGKKK
jgi:rRNA maturation endonuclease Nob1